MNGENQEKTTVTHGGWNRPREGAAKVKAAPSRGRGLVAGTALVIAVGAAVWFIFGRSSTEPEQTKTNRNRTIAEVTPAPAPKAEPVEEKPAPVDPNARPTKVGEKLNGYIKLPSGRLHRVKGEVTNSVSASIKGKYAIFDHHCENEIACLLWLKPGDIIVGTPRYNGNFTKEFLESLKTPIVVTEDDTPEQAELKRAVTQTKIEMKAAYDRGEDIEKMMLDTRKELQDLARYKFDIQMQLYDFKKKEDITQEDVDDFVTACNKLLEQKGIAPLRVGPLTRKNLELYNSKE